MTPTFHPGQVLHINPQISGIAPGDVIVFQKQDDKDHAVHRVIAVTENGYITRGDNNLITDMAPVLPDQVVGRVKV